MDALTGFTSTSFGYLIAILVPGFAATYSASFFSASLQAVLHTFENAQSNLGLFLMVVLASMAVGLVLMPFRSFVYETLLCHSTRFPDDYSRLAEDGTLKAFRAAVDENYRYYQSWGSLSLVLPAYVAAFFLRHSHDLQWYQLAVAAVVGVAAEVAVVVAAKNQYESFAGKASALLLPAVPP
jgi:hypothetical protein